MKGATVVSTGSGGDGVQQVFCSRSDAWHRHLGLAPVIFLGHVIIEVLLVVQVVKRPSAADVATAVLSTVNQSRMASSYRRRATTATVDPRNQIGDTRRYRLRFVVILIVIGGSYVIVLFTNVVGGKRERGNTIGA